MYTQCPECGASYEVGEEALRAALGIVACGHCGKRFDALRNLSFTPPPGAPSLPGAGIAAQPPTLAPLPSAGAKPRKGRRADDVAGAPAPSATDPHAAGARTAQALTEPAVVATHEDWFAGIEREMAASGEAASVPHAATPERFTRPAARAASNRVAPAGGPAQASLPLAPPPADPAPQPEAPPADERPAAESAAGASVDSAAPTGDTGVLEARVEADVAILAGAQARAATDREPIPPAGDSPPIYVPPRRRVSRASIAWALGSVVLALALAAQLAWIERAELVRDPATQNWMARACGLLRCQLPLIRDPARLQIISRDVRRDPDDANALAISATVRNEADFTQPWPVLAVQFSDLDNAPVAMRRFRPAEYLPDAARRDAGIPAGATAVVALRVADPGRRAVAFHFEVE